MAADTNAAADIVYVNFGTTGPSVSGLGASKHHSTSSFKINGSAVKLYGSWRKSGAAYVGKAGISGLGLKVDGVIGSFAKNYAAGQSILGHSTHPAARLRTAVHRATGFSTKGNFGAGQNATHRVGSVTGYVGFRSAHGDLGWMKVKVGSPGTKAGVSLQVLSYAYNNVPGGPIKAGQTTAIPEPGTMALVLMAAGAAGLTALRRAKSVPAAEPAGSVTETTIDAESA
jgi:hypothetical protein